MLFHPALAFGRLILPLRLFLTIALLIEFLILIGHGTSSFEVLFEVMILMWRSFGGLLVTRAKAHVWSICSEYWWLDFLGRR
ncbi:hypothetical protein CAK95_14360 [Pseudorhodoplanes sinuspersici]|uniref:Uncharacterized protein n=1 Tax=Pseudorhodoplanes sinuspersici TaxID=1235591 RepID=A0A1W6ZRZ9_9HYPH|nr:hypothetical protein CAK95_14360 [Pseudorhodoplanes sinuspersici]